MFGIVLFVGTVTPALTALPAAIAAVAGEVLRIRSWMYCVLAGGAAMAVIPCSPRRATPAARHPSWPIHDDLRRVGFVGGFIYWLLAGRGA